MKYEEYIGKGVIAIGDCGMTKDRQVSGILRYDNAGYFYLENQGRVYSVNENTIKLLTT